MQGQFQLKLRERKNSRKFSAETEGKQKYKDRPFQLKLRENKNTRNVSVETEEKEKYKDRVS